MSGTCSSVRVLALLLVARLLVATSHSYQLTGASLDRQLLKLEELQAIEQRPLANHLARSAPYAIQSDYLNEATTMRNIVLKLASNTTLNANSQTTTTTTTSASTSTIDSPQQQQQQQQQVEQQQQRTGSLAGIRANLNLRKLLEALEFNNLTSEVRFENNDSSLINITISNINDSEKIDSLFLEEFLISSTGDSLDPPTSGLADLARQTTATNETSSSSSGGANVVKDNHQQPAPVQRVEEKRQLVRVGDHLSSIMTAVPPIRSIIEAAPENYTMRRVAEEANVFALRLLHQLNIEKLGSRNLIQAPFPVYQGLALLATGAMGDTSRELERVLLQGAQDNARLNHHQHRPRLLASFSDSVRQLQLSATHHFRVPINESSGPSSGAPAAASGLPGKYWVGGTQEQHLIVANNLLFSPAAYEIAPEFKTTLDTYYNNTVLTKIEIGSTESIHKINSWIRAATGGLIPLVLHKKNTFDEFNVMALLCTSWLAQEWHDTFYRVSSPVRSSIRLKGQARALQLGGGGGLLEFEDDNKQSHFVDFIKSKPSENIQHYHAQLAGQLVDIVSVPLKHSNHRLVALTPIVNPAGASQSSVNNSTAQIIGELTAAAANTNSINTTASELPDSSALSKLITALTGSPTEALRSLWNIVAPKILTKQVLKTLQESRPTRSHEEASGEQHDGQPLDEQEQHQRMSSRASHSPLVQLSMPIIRGEADSSVSAALNHIGLVNAFDPDQANFIGINGHPFNYHKLHLSNVLSKTTFNLNEQGINYDKTIRTLESLRVFPNRRNKQAASSNPKQHQQQQQQQHLNIEDEDDLESFKQQIKSNSIDQVELNKPFMYLICDIRTKLILYTGVVRNPEQEGP